MINRLRKRFVCITMGSVIAVLTILMAGVNLSSFLNADKTASQRLEILAENNGFFPNFAAQQDDESQPNTLPPTADRTRPADSFAEAAPDEDHMPAGHRRLSPEAPYETRYFSVELKADGTLANVNTGKIAAVSSEQAVAMARELSMAGKASGYDGSYKYLAQAMADGGVRYIFLDCTRELTAAKAFLRNSVLVSLGGALAVLALVLALSKRAIRPMAESYEKQKQFITNAGHEMKTPLTIIDSCTEVLEMEQGGNKWTEGIRAQVHRLTELTVNLVSLTRMDEDGGRLPMEEFDLSAMMTDALEPFSLLAESCGLTLETDIQSGIRYRGSEAALRQLCSILADNAVKYALPESTIYFSLKRKGRKILLISQNEAEGLQKGDLELLFDRFYRGDASRSGEKSGSGIGLSLARSIVTAHGGQITARSEDGKTLTVAARL